jgi:hypothetical protein
MYEIWPFLLSISDTLATYHGDPLHHAPPLLLPYPAPVNDTKKEKTYVTT